MAKKARRGKRMTKGAYSITAKKGRRRTFTGTLKGTMNIGNVRVAIFSVPKGEKII